MRPPDGAPSVLLVDDDERILTALQRTLRREGYELLTARSGPAALRLLAERRVDLVISDQKMPGMCGMEFLGEVARRAPGVARILITGWPEAVPAADLEGLGIRALVPKPWDHFHLKDAVRASLGPVPGSPSARG